MNVKRKQKISVVCSLLMSVIPLVTFAQQAPPANVNIALIKQVTLSPVAWVSGTVVSRNNAKIAAEISGRLVSLVELGANVSKGQVIAQIDNQTLQLKLREEQAIVENAQSTLAFEQSEVTRNTSLVKKNLVSKTELEKTLSKRNIAQGDLIAAKARLAQTKQNIEYTQLKAPFNGIVAERISHQGEYVDNGTAIVRLVDTANLEASLFAPLTAYQYIKNTKQLNIRSPLGDAVAKIKTIIPIADSRSHLMEVRLDMSDIDWPVGLNIKASVATGKSKEVLAAPRDALVLRRNNTSIFLIKNSKAQQVNIDTGIADGELIEVIGNITVGDSVVIRGAERLKSGQTVNIKNNNQSLISGK